MTQTTTVRLKTQYLTKVLTGASLKKNCIGNYFRGFSCRELDERINSTFMSVPKSDLFSWSYELVGIA